MGHIDNFLALRGGSRTLSLVLGGVSDIRSETRWGQYFAVEGREIEGPPPPGMFLAASLNVNLWITLQQHPCLNDCVVFHLNIILPASVHSE